MMLYGCVGGVRPRDFSSMRLQAPLQIALWLCLVVQGVCTVLTWMCIMPCAHQPEALPGQPARSMLNIYWCLSDRH